MHSRIKIGFDVSPLADEEAFGVSRYAIHLIQALAEAGEFDLCLLYPWSLKVGKEEMAQLKVQQIGLQLRVLGTRWWEQLFMPLLAARAGCDAIHSVANVAPVLSSRPVILTLHDTITYAGDADVSAATMTYLRSFGARAVRSAAAIITVSEFSRHEIVNRFHVEDGKVQVIPNGVSREYFAVSKTHEFSQLAPVVLACGSLAPSKNLRGTLDAFARILCRFPKAKLELFSIAPNTENLIRKWGSEAGIPASALACVHAPDDLDMSRVFADADVLVFPSLNEGFGLPVAEAFAAGVPVVTSNVGALAEVSGGAALLVDPNDSAAIACAAIGILEHSELRRGLRERGRRRSAAFTWGRAAEETAAVYRRVLCAQADWGGLTSSVSTQGEVASHRG